MAVTVKQQRGSGELYAIFGGTIFLSAFLLFSVQPMFTKLVLPVLGGTPAVWSVAMVVFQTLLLAGYVYAHLLSTYFARRTAVLLHLLFSAAAFAALPFSLSAAWGAPPAGGELAWLVLVSLSSIGLPFFVLSANGPLLQAWAAPIAFERGWNVYGFYAVSNAGSFLALFGYLVVIEPLLPLSHQADLWRWAFGALLLGLAACGILVAPYTQSPASMDQPATNLSMATRLRWIGLAAVPSGLLLAVTSYIQTDIASVPLFWVVPLAIYLLSFILAFREQSPALLKFWTFLQVAATATALVSLILPLPLLFKMAAALAALLGTAMVCHSTLYSLRPPASRLTEFYACTSLGGALGGLFVGLAAPYLFNTVAEFPLLLVAGLMGRPGFPDLHARGRQQLKRVIAGLLVLGVATLLIPGDHLAKLAYLVVLYFAAMLIFWRLPLVAFLCAAMVMGLSAAVHESNSVFQRRGFFGVLKISDYDNHRFRALLHGTTIHGGMLLAEDRAGQRPTPLTYYAADGTLADALALARNEGEATSSEHMGVVGLGVGNMACHARAGETWAFYEINPLVIEMARDPSHFRFLSACGAGMRIIQGDARLTLAKETPSSFDFLLMDAFSSDAIPTHLLTVEAVRNLLRVMKPNGVLAFHITNRHMDLAPILARAASAQGVRAFHKATHYSAAQLREYRTNNRAVIFLRDPVKVKRALAQGWEPLSAAPEQPLWTDNYVNILGALIKGALAHQTRK